MQKVLKINFNHINCFPIVSFSPNVKFTKIIDISKKNVQLFF